MPMRERAIMLTSVRLTPTRESAIAANKESAIAVKQGRAITVKKVLLQ